MSRGAEDYEGFGRDQGLYRRSPTSYTLVACHSEMSSINARSASLAFVQAEVKDHVMHDHPARAEAFAGTQTTELPHG